MTVASVVFDLDGTLVDTMGSVPRAYAAAIRALGGPEVTPDQVVEVWHMGPTPVVLAHFLGREATEDDLECYFRHAATDVRVFPGVADMLRALARTGVRLGVYTTATRRAAARVLASTGLAGYFSAVVAGDEVARPKPAPEGLELACELLGVRAAEAAYVGNEEVDLRCAEAAGSLGVHAAWDAPARSVPPVPRVPLVAARPLDVVTLLGLPGEE
ncbi:HAD family hydrolase [Thermoactinospora rubra]|uniref:HAD family hydrolase n=1 Tax=Thermoactinospora rubra TaxID=1088767 RepID=UPI000A10D477|nr:HAD-IA family hydrolase [Thermoactinospora rubra]